MDHRLAAAIIHDIKNALGALEGELLAMTDAPTRERAVSAHGACRTMRERLIGFLTLYRADTGGLAPRVDEVFPADFLAAVLREHASVNPALRYAVDDAAMPALAFFDEHLVGLALEAALQNAGRFARSAVTLGCRADGDDLVLWVRDDGPGPGAAEATPSTGLGMSLCGAIAAAHRRHGRGGSVSLEAAPGGGALFQMRLP